MVPTANKLSAVAAGARFEAQCAHLLQSMRCALSSASNTHQQSHTHVRAGGGGPGDRGIDLAGVWHFVSAAPCAVVAQCKHWRAPIGSAAIRDFVGSVASIRSPAALPSGQTLAPDQSQAPNQSSTAARASVASTGNVLPTGATLSPVAFTPVGIFMSSSRFTSDAVAAAHAASNVPLLLLHCCEVQAAVDVDTSNRFPHIAPLPRSGGASQNRATAQPAPPLPISAPSHPVTNSQSPTPPAQPSLPDLPLLHISSLVMNAAARKRLPHLGTARPRQQSVQPSIQSPDEPSRQPQTIHHTQIATVVELVEHASDGACFRLQLESPAERPL